MFSNCYGKIRLFIVSLVQHQEENLMVRFSPNLKKLNFPGYFQFLLFPWIPKKSLILPQQFKLPSAFFYFAKFGVTVYNHLCVLSKGSMRCKKLSELCSATISLTLYRPNTSGYIYSAQMIMVTCKRFHHLLYSQLNCRERRLDKQNDVIV